MSDSHSTDRKLTVCVEGNIGSGKTTLLEYFAQDANVEVLQEPVNKWRNVHGYNALAKLYEDPRRWSLTFQTYVQLTMLNNHLTTRTRPVMMMERSIYSSKYCFVENLYHSDLMSEFEYVILSEWFNWIVKTQDVSVDLIVYLKTKPETCYQRIKQRQRVEEAEIPLAYLHSLHKLHEDWLVHKTTFDLPCPVLVLNADSDLTTMQLRYEESRQQILCKT